MGAIGLSLGYAFSMEGAGKLVPMTYLLVIVNNMEEELALLYALSRFLGILVGVACLHLSTIIVFQVRARACLGKKTFRCLEIYGHGPSEGLILLNWLRLPTTEFFPSTAEKCHRGGSDSAGACARGADRAQPSRVVIPTPLTWGDHGGRVW